jgi:thiamine pyrophosphate-dependent acetolactate synthase large subunit-like protein
LNGDGSFGQNAMELDSAVRHKLPLLCVISLNGGWTAEPEGNKPRRLGRLFRLAPDKPTPLLFAVIPKKYSG